MLVRFQEISLLLSLFLAAVITGCTGPQQSQNNDDSSNPPLILSSEEIHSPSGDLSARLPYKWVIIDAGQLETPQVFAALCNPEYTVSVIFSEAAIDNAIRTRLSRDGLHGLVDASFQRRWKRSQGRAKMIGETEEIVIGKRGFRVYTYSTDSMQTTTRVAIFLTNNHLYECAITPLTFSPHEIPDQQTLRLMHQLILKGLEWQ